MAVSYGSVNGGTKYGMVLMLCPVADENGRLWPGHFLTKCYQLPGLCIAVLSAWGILCMYLVIWHVKRKLLRKSISHDAFQAPTSAPLVLPKLKSYKTISKTSLERRSWVATGMFCFFAPSKSQAHSLTTWLLRGRMWGILVLVKNIADTVWFESR